MITALAIVGYSAGEEYRQRLLSEMRENSTVINNQIYAQRYRDLLNSHLKTDGYVTLERLVYYLQRTKNVLDTSKLSYEDWNNAYLKNVNKERKQMIPIKTICKEIEEDTTLPEYTISSGKNANGVEIDKIDLCNIDGMSVAYSDEYSDEFIELPFVFPFSKNQSFSVTSIVFETREIEFGFDRERQNSVNHHSGWDLGVPVGTDVYSICDGTVSSIVNTQPNDLNYYQSKNDTGNYVYVTCDNGYKATYGHLKYRSTPEDIKVGSHVNKGTLIAKTSTTGVSTGPHLHLGLSDETGKLLDAFAYINFLEKEE